MQRYGNLSERSGVLAYELGPDCIRVKFVDGWVYEYGEPEIGAETLADMVQLAREGRGLSTFISRHVRERYRRKSR